MKKLTAFLVSILAFFLLLSCQSPYLKIYVSPNGNDSADGSRNAPLKSLQHAAALAREKAGTEPVTIYLAGGTHHLKAPLMLGPEDGGSAEAPVRWENKKGESPIISGGVSINDWKLEADGSWSAQLPEDFQGPFRSLYVNGKRARRARHPDSGYLRIKKAGEDNRTHFFFQKDDLPRLESTRGLELILLHDWSITRTPVGSIDWESRRLDAVDSIGSRLNFFTLTHWEKQPRYFLENAREFCDQPGEWYADFDSRTLYYQALPGEKLLETQAVIPISEKLIVLEGSKEKPIEHISFSGITFEHSGWTLPEKGYFGIQACMFSDRSKSSGAWAKVPAAIELDRANSCNFESCILRHTGGSGLWIRENCSNCAITDCYFYDISGNGIAIGEGQDRLVDGQAWWKAAPEEVSAGNKVSHSLIERCGQQFYGAVGLWCGLVAHTVIEYNEIRDLPYTGVSVGWMWTPEPTPCMANTIHANHIHHILNILSDGGGIYSLGLQPLSKITHNLIHDVEVNAGRAESNGMFLDEGTKELVISDNIIYEIAKSPLRFHKAVAPTLVSNNVLACKDGRPPIAYNRTLEEDIEKQNNTVLFHSSAEDSLKLEEAVKLWFEKLR